LERNDDSLDSKDLPVDLLIKTVLVKVGRKLFMQRFDVDEKQKSDQLGFSYNFSKAIRPGDTQKKFGVSFSFALIRAGLIKIVLFQTSLVVVGCLSMLH
jgi:hypothetical protein